MPGVREIPGVLGQVEWLQYDSAGRLVGHGQQHNLFLDQGRSAYAGALRAATVSAPRWFQFGTGTAQPAITDTALQSRVTAKSATSILLEADFTARVSTTLEATEMTGLIREALLGTVTGAVTNTAWAKATLSANHVSGNTVVFHWRFAMQG